MTRHLMIAALFATVAAPAIADDPNSKGAAVSPGGITVSCYRGPWKAVIWDRPNAVFIESLVAVGYDYANANAIGETVCRDAALVDNPEGLRTTMRRIYAESASERHRTR